jgi:hypothetical protein
MTSGRDEKSRYTAELRPKVIFSTKRLTAEDSEVGMEKQRTKSKSEASAQ